MGCVLNEQKCMQYIYTVRLFYNFCGLRTYNKHTQSIIGRNIEADITSVSQPRNCCLGIEK